MEKESYRTEWIFTPPKKKSVRQSPNERWTKAGVQLCAPRAGGNCVRDTMARTITLPAVRLVTCRKNTARIATYRRACGTAPTHCSLCVVKCVPGAPSDHCRISTAIRGTGDVHARLHGALVHPFRGTTCQKQCVTNVGGDCAQYNVARTHNAAHYPEVCTNRAARIAPFTAGAATSRT